MEVKLIKDDVSRYKREGYLIVPHFFDADEVKALQADLQRLVDEGMLHNVATEGDGKTRSTTAINLQICPVGPHSELIRALPFSDKVRDAVQALLGDECVQQLDQIFLKPPRLGAGTNWHQDNAYFKATDPALGLGMWIALHDATVENGTMHIVPRSHKKTYGHDRDPGSNHHIHCVIDEERETVVPAVMEAGGVLFFNFGIAHCTKANQTESARAGLALHFIHASMVGTVAGKDNRPFLTGPRYSRGREEYGQDMEAAWAERVAALRG